jgi:hypothetical protein
MPERQEQKPDASQEALRAVERITGEPLVEDGAELLGDPELERKYREAMAKERERKEAAATRQIPKSSSC